MSRLTRALAVATLACSAALALPGCGVAYVLRSGYYQAELLTSARPIDRVLAEGELSAGQEQRLRLIPELKAYGKTIGLLATDNYGTVAHEWNRTIWNVSASDPLAFSPRTWWFPIVGRVPYLGYFVEDEARAQERLLRDAGYDVHVRTAGAYSTLGWFRDPVLPGMLRWSEADLAETVFHELAHATLWVPGSVAFNESFASFVGEVAVERWLADRYGEDGAPLQELRRQSRDARRFEAVLHGLYEDLDTVYRDPAIAVAEKEARKRDLYASLETRLLEAGLEEPLPYVNGVRRTTWNNARLMQFRTYNANEEWFAALWERSDGDIRAFIETVRTITRNTPDPFAALERAAKGDVKIP